MVASIFDSFKRVLQKKSKKEVCNIEKCDVAGMMWFCMDDIQCRVSLESLTNSKVKWSKIIKDFEDKIDEIKYTQPTIGIANKMQFELQEWDTDSLHVPQDVYQNWTTPQHREHGLNIIEHHLSKVDMTDEEMLWLIQYATDVPAMCLPILRSINNKETDVLCWFVCNIPMPIEPCQSFGEFVSNYLETLSGQERANQLEMWDLEERKTDWREVSYSRKPQVRQNLC